MSGWAWKVAAFVVSGAIGFGIFGPALARILVHRALRTDTLADFGTED